jgi:hypothetical protein
MRCGKHLGMPEAGPRPSKQTSRRRTAVHKSNPVRKSKPGQQTRSRARQWPDPSSQSARRTVIPPTAAVPVQRGPKTPVPKTPRRRRPDTLTEREQSRVDIAAEFCVDTLIEGWPDAVAGQAQKCLTTKTWNRMFGRQRQGDCKILADMAKELLEKKKALHDFIGAVASRVTGWLGGRAFECSVARELAQRIPIPVLDDKTVVVARCLQMIGILLCLSQGIPLNRCQSFIDLALAETKERVEEIMVEAMEDWRSPNPELLTIWRPR